MKRGPRFLRCLRSTTAFVPQQRRYVRCMLGVPFSKGQGKRGTEHGPALMRTSDLQERLRKLGVPLVDEGDVVVDDPAPSSKSRNNRQQQNGEGEVHNVHNAREVSQLCQTLSHKVADIARRGDFCLTIGGDHSIACGTIFGQATVRDNLAVVWVDAHPDGNSPKTSPTGNLHGMVMSLLLQQSNTIMIPGFEWCHPVLPPHKLVYIGLREVDPGEQQLIDQLKIKAFPMSQVDRLGIARVMEEALDHVDPKGNSQFHMSYDVDSVEPYYVPSTGTPVDGGLTLREGLYVCEAVSQTNRLVAMDLVEINPAIGTVEDVARTVETATQIICSTLMQDRTMIYSRFDTPSVKSEQHPASASLG